jgi:hypothetical protein
MASSDDPLAKGYELAYTEARRALDEQAGVVNDLRSRAGVVLAASAVTTSFFGREALSDHALGTAGWLALSAFASLGLAILVILWPWRDWTFTVHAPTFIANYLEPPPPVDDSGAPPLEPLPLPAVHRDLALHMSASYTANARQLRWLMLAFRVSALLLTVEVIAWLVALASET